MAPTSVCESHRKSHPSRQGRPLASQATSRNQSVTFKPELSSTSQGQLLEIVLEEIRKLNMPGERARGASIEKDSSEPFVLDLRLIESGNKLIISRP